MDQTLDKHLKEKFQKCFDDERKSSESSPSRPKIPNYSLFKDISESLNSFFKGLSSLPEPSKSKLRDNLYLLNDLFTECRMLTRKQCSFKFPQEMITKNRINMDLNKIKKELKHMESQPSNTQPNSSSPKADFDWLWTTRSVDASKVYGFDDDVVAVTKLLVQQGRNDGKFKAVGVVGREGIGKTTLCQVMFNKPEVLKDKFLPRIWVCMARYQDDENDLKVMLVKRMLMSLGVRKETVKSICEEHDLGGLLYALHLQLAGKRYLIVLDDARDMDSWYGKLDSCLTGDMKWGDRLAFGLPKGHGGRVIVTSRDEGLLRLMVGEENMHQLLPLSDPEHCWKIFQDADKNKCLLEKLKQKQKDQENLKLKQEDEAKLELKKEDLAKMEEELKLKLKQECGGVPLAAKMMGKAMEDAEQEQEAKGENMVPKKDRANKEDDRKTKNAREGEVLKKGKAKEDVHQKDKAKEEEGGQEKEKAKEEDGVKEKEKVKEEGVQQIDKEKEGGIQKIERAKEEGVQQIEKAKEEVVEEKEKAKEEGVEEKEKVKDEDVEHKLKAKEEDVEQKEKPKEEGVQQEYVQKIDKAMEEVAQQREKAKEEDVEQKEKPKEERVQQEYVQKIEKAKEQDDQQNEKGKEQDAQQNEKAKGEDVQEKEKVMEENVGQKEKAKEEDVKEKETPKEEGVQQEEKAKEDVEQKEKPKEEAVQQKENAKE